MKDKKKWGWILGAAIAVILIVVGIVSLGKGEKPGGAGETEESQFNAEEAEKLLAETFTKTIHDFPGHLIDNLDEQEDTNFVVYAKGVKRVTAEGDTNVILSVDEEKLQYVIANPDDQITSLENGDIFFMDPSENYGLGISVKVEDLEVQEDQVVIQGEEFPLEDLIEYADVDMMIPIEQVYVLQEGGIEGWTVELSDETVQTSTYPENGEQNGTETIQLDAVPTDDELQGMMSELMSGDQLWKLPDESGTETDGGIGSSIEGGSSAVEEEETQKTWWQEVYDVITIGRECNVPVINAGTALDFSYGKFHAKGTFSIQMSHIHVKYRISPILAIGDMGFNANIKASIRGNFEGKLGGNIDTKKLLERLTSMLKLRVPVAGPIMLMADLIPSMDVSGSVGASLGWSGEFNTNISMFCIGGVWNPSGIGAQGINANVNYSLAELNGRFAVNVIDADVAVGVPLVGEVNARLKAGLELKGKVQHPNVSEDINTNVESVHECFACVDGQCNAMLRLDTGVDVTLIKDQIKPAKLNWTIINSSIPVIKPFDRFYISLREGEDIDFGLGKCPNRRWRTEITVRVKETKDLVRYVHVDAAYPDGRTDSGISGEHGKLTLYLPNGDNLLSAKEDELHLYGSAHAVIENKPTEVELLLSSGNLHIIFADHEQDPVIDTYDTNSWYELQEKLINMYPEAQWHQGFELEELIADEKVSQGNIVVDITYDAPHTGYGQWNDDYLEDGDNSNIWGEGGGWIYVEISRICKDQDSGQLIPKYTFGISVSYDPARKAYLRYPQISTAEYIVKITQDVSGIYNDEYLLIGYGPKEEGIQTWAQDTKYSDTDYKYDTDAIRGGSRERYHMPSMLAEHLFPFVEAMIEQWDLDQIMVVWNE